MLFVHQNLWISKLRCMFVRLFFGKVVRHEQCFVVLFFPELWWDWLIDESTTWCLVMIFFQNERYLCCLLSFTCNDSALEIGKFFGKLSYCKKKRNYLLSLSYFVLITSKPFDLYHGHLSLALLYVLFSVSWICWKINVLSLFKGMLLIQQLLLISRENGWVFVANPSHFCV